MTRTELINRVKTAMDGTGVHRTTVEAIVKATFDNIGQVLRDGDELSIVGFGSFKVKHVPARTYRNPRTGGAVDTPAKTVVKFKASPALLS